MNWMKKIPALLVLLFVGGGIAYAGLETVTHIQDLNSAWPLGSDLASTSDDHIRNIKSALKTDFPNFNGTYTSATAPVFAIPSDTNTGMYSVGADDLGFTTGGTLRFDISTTAFTGTLPWRGQDGLVGTPGISFSSDPDTGFYHSGGNEFKATAGGTDAARFGFSTTAFLQIADGSVGQPGLGFISDPDTGLYHIGANNMGLSSGGVNTVQFIPTATQFIVQAQTLDGSAGTPGWSFFADPDTGFYRDTANQIGIALGGVTIGQVASTSATLTVTGCTTSPTTSAVIKMMGSIVELHVPAVTCTSNATTFTLTGLPALVRPASTTGLGTVYTATDNTAAQIGTTGFDVSSSGTITFYKSGSSGGWTGSGTKGLGSNVTMMYPIL